MASEQEMMADLASADAAGDHELAQRIANQIKASRAQPDKPMTIGERLKAAAHATAGYLPAAGAIAGGAMGAVAGTPADLLTGPMGTVGGAAIGAGLLSAGGKMAQHAIDSALGYEENPGVVSATKDALKTGATDAALTGGTTMAAQTISAASRPLMALASRMRAGAPKAAEILFPKAAKVYRLLQSAEAPASTPAAEAADPFAGVRMPASRASLTTTAPEPPPEAYPPRPAPEAPPQAAQQTAPPSQTLEQMAAAPHEPQMAGESFGKGPSRLQRGATKAQLAYRAKMLGQPQPAIGPMDLSGETQAKLLRQLEADAAAPASPATPDEERAAILERWRALRSDKPKLMDLLESIRRKAAQ